MKYVSRYLDGDVPRAFLVKLHQLWSKVLSCYWTSFTWQKIFISDPNWFLPPSPKLNNKIKTRWKPKIRNHQHITRKITRRACYWVWVLAVRVQKQQVCIVYWFFPSYCSCLTGGLKWWRLSLLNDMQILMSVHCIKQERVGYDPFSVIDQ